MTNKNQLRTQVESVTAYELRCERCGDWIHSEQIVGAISEADEKGWTVINNKVVCCYCNNTK